jgi:hypothetical protein
MCGICISRKLPIVPIEYDDVNNSKESYCSSTQVAYLDLTLPHTCPECG